MTNLLANAAEDTVEGGAIHVREGRDDVVLEVIDTGPPIPEEVLFDRLPAPMSRALAARTPESALPWYGRSARCCTRPRRPKTVPTGAFGSPSGARRHEPQPNAIPVHAKLDRTAGKRNGHPGGPPKWPFFCGRCRD